MDDRATQGEDARPEERPLALEAVPGTPSPANARRALLSVTDAAFVALILAALGAELVSGWRLPAYRSLLRDLAFITAYVPFTFFLFCNLLKVKRLYELLWVALFVLLCASCLLVCGRIVYPVVLVPAAVATALFSLPRFRKVHPPRP